MQIQTKPSDAEPAAAPSALRQDVVADLLELQQAVSALRAKLSLLESRVERARLHLAAGGPAADLPRVAHVMESRAEVNGALAEVQRMRHRSQRSLFLLAVEEGFSLAEIARTWGISRQLVSRMTKEPADKVVED
ncbi:MAG TPA: hypothetical protein VN781_02470 [Acidimicrobiales bacterium]|nr:hypothetical protein [Acidimicrobiales bacterium]